jgi:chromosome segregation ATPase
MPCTATVCAKRRCLWKRLLTSIALVVFLKRTRKSERQLRLRLETLEREQQSPPPAPTLESESPKPSSEGVDAYRLQMASAAEIDRSVQQLQQRLQETNECLESVTAELQKEKELSEHSQATLEVLRQNLQSMVDELQILKEANARLQEELRSKSTVTGGAVLADRRSREKILSYIKRLRDDVAASQHKLTDSEVEVVQLRKDKESLVNDLNGLTQEYERLYANFRSMS